MDNPTRKGTPPLKVYALPAERAEIQKQAAAAGLSVSAYLLKVGLGYQVRGVLDHKAIEELVRINGDLGRLGGLLKLWLTDDPRTLHYGEATIRALLARIEGTQELMRATMQTVLLPRTER